MKIAPILGFVGIAALVYVVYRSHREQQVAVLKSKPMRGPGPTRDVYSGQYIDPIRPRFPYNAALVQPHKDIYTGKLVSNHEPFPSQTKDIAENHIVSKMVHEFTSEGRLDSETSGSLHSRIKTDYMNEIAKIAKLNHYKLKPLSGEGLSEYSTLILTVASNHGLYLSSSARARYQAQQYVKPHVNVESVNSIIPVLSVEED